MRPLSLLFQQIRHHSHTALKPLSYFFVDTNVIIGYRLEQYQGIRDFIEDPSHKFFYTETVLKELQTKKNRFPEADPDKLSSPLFHYITSKISPLHMQKSIALLHKLWLDEFSGEEFAAQRGFQLSEKQLLTFNNDLRIVFEAGFTCHAADVLPPDDFRTPPLLTNNMRLLKKFMLTKRAEEVVEQTINMSGLEHLIPTQYLEDAIEAWQERPEIQKKSGI
ncbi:MAG: hypothetical protein DHS20C10_02840 [marine bacterium B5-7]|nr:MAG: hypothetical protein DHS20C10_02840 [marine bacterium B5-7]